MTVEERIMTTITTMYEIKFTLKSPKNWHERFKIYKDMLTFVSGYKMAIQDLTNLHPNNIHHVVTKIYNEIEKKYRKA